MLQQAKQKENGCVSINHEKAHGEIINKNTAHGGFILTFRVQIIFTDTIKSMKYSGDFQRGINTFYVCLSFLNLAFHP